MTKDLKEDDMASNPPETPVSAGLLEAGRALYAAIGTYQKPEQGFLTPELIAAGTKWCAAIAKADAQGLTTSRADIATDGDVLAGKEG